MKIVRVRNMGSTPFKFKFDNEPYVVAPSSESLVPYGAMVLVAGNPDARNLNSRQRNRLLEFTRLRTKYGAYEDDGKWEKNRPAIEFYTMDGDRIWTVLDDPDGERVNPNLADEQSNATLTAQLSSLQAQMSQVLGMIKSGELVLADKGGAGTVATLDQLGADDAERQIGLDTDPSTLPPLVVTEPEEAPIVSEGGDGPPMADLDTTPPTDAPKSVKVGGRSTKTPNATTTND